MLPLFLSGVLFAGLVLLDKLRKPSESWYSQEEFRKFQQQREKSLADEWRLYR